MGSFLKTCLCVDSSEDDDWCFMATIAHLVGWMSRTASKGNETKSKMKPTSDMSKLRFEHAW